MIYLYWGFGNKVFVGICMGLAFCVVFFIFIFVQKVENKQTTNNCAVLAVHFVILFCCRRVDGDGIEGRHEAAGTRMEPEVV